MAHKTHKPVAAKAPAPAKQISVQLNGPKLAADLTLGDPRPLIDEIEKERASRVLSLVYNTGANAPLLAPALIPQLEHILTRIGPVPKLDVFLRTTGGLTEVPWRVVSLLREFSDELGVIVSRVALSGGCHIALAGDDLIMTAFSVLGSVDPTRNHPLLPKDSEDKTIPTSVQDLKHCIEFIREQLGESYSSQNLALIISELFKYINPLALGALEQAYSLARLITKKVLKTRKKPLDDEAIKHIVDVLSGQYYSHSFLISRAEVESDLKLPVIKPAGKLLEAITNLEAYYDAQFQKTVVAAPPSPEPIARIGAFLQTTQDAIVISQLFNQAGALIADPWIKIYPEVNP